MLFLMVIIPGRAIGKKALVVPLNVDLGTHLQKTFHIFGLENDQNFLRVYLVVDMTDLKARSESHFHYLYSI